MWVEWGVPEESGPLGSQFSCSSFVLTIDLSEITMVEGFGEGSGEGIGEEEAEGELRSGRERLSVIFSRTSFPVELEADTMIMNKRKNEWEMEMVTGRES